MPTVQLDPEKRIVDDNLMPVAMAWRPAIIGLVDRLVAAASDAGVHNADRRLIVGAVLLNAPRSGKRLAQLITEYQVARVKAALPPRPGRKHVTVKLLGKGKPPHAKRRALSV